MPTTIPTIIVMFCLILLGFMVVYMDKHKGERSANIFAIIYKILGGVVIIMAGVTVFDMFS
jgi:cytochrome bd-type quinol oxidase subunit 2